jgi:hypothetical protein
MSLLLTFINYTLQTKFLIKLIGCKVFFLNINVGIENAEYRLKLKSPTEGRNKVMARKKLLRAGLTGVLMTLLSTPAFARSVEWKEAGTALWIFLIIGSIIILLQLIPAAILFFSFIGTTTTTVLKKEKKVEEGVVLPGSEPVAVKK